MNLLKFANVTMFVYFYTVTRSVSQKTERLGKSQQLTFIQRGRKEPPSNLPLTDGKTDGVA